MSLDLSKSVQTRDGRPARIICTDMKADYPMIALVVHRHSPTETAYFFSKDGSYTEGTPHPFDLINVPQKHTGWVNVYREGTVSIRPTKESADENGGPGRIACIKVEFTEGEGL